VDPVPDSEAWAVANLIGDRRSGLLLTPKNEPGGDLLHSRSLKDAMVVALRGDSGMVGTILVGNRLGDVTTFDHNDLTLLETLASQVGAALENNRLERRLQRQAFHDSLTSLANRALFHDRVKHALARRESGGVKPVAVLLLDIDDFKLVNDSQGHTAGDRLLIGVGERVRACVRPFDTVARLGGDEFAVLLEDSTASEAMAASRRILASLQTPFEVHGQYVTVHASIGVAVSGKGLTSVDKLLAHADLAMYHAKSRGKGRYEVFDPILQAAVVERHTLQAELEHATDEDRVIVEYQPFVDLRTGSVAAVEALVRWRHPTRGVLSPAEFVPLAEETGLIVPIGRAVLEQACRQAAKWGSRSGAAGPLSMSVNVSVRQFQQGDFVEDVTRILRTTRLSPSRLILELTESIMVEGSPAVVEKLHRLKALGVQLAIDDFGTGYSSLSALRALPIDMLKIAKPFVDGVGVDAEHEAFAHAILRMGATLDLRMVAEGIETELQANWLRNLGCDLGQGYYFARPLSAEDLEGVLDAHGVIEHAGVRMSSPARERLTLSA
jgi:diguanylate cyclase (GGDEF)-like protein